MPGKGLLLMALLALGALAGAGLVYVFAPGPDTPHTGAAAVAPAKTPPQDTRLEDQLARLQSQLAQAAEERAWLMERLATLEARSAVIDDIPDSDTPALVSGADTPPGTPTPAYHSGVEALIAAGIPEEQAAWLQTHLDESDLQQLYLKDRATREGWLRTPRYSRAVRELQEAFKDLRPEIGDETYDRLLYALGRSNRVVVRNVIQYSSADQAGLQAGDRIIEYAGQRVFSTQELNGLASGGTAGVPVLVRVQRAGQTLDVYLPRGPLGVRPVPGREAPE